MPDLDTLESQFVELRRNRDFKRGRKGSGPTYRKGATRMQVLEARDAWSRRSTISSSAPMPTSRRLLHGELKGCVDRYAQLKAREGALDFLDLLLRARDLVHGDEGGAAAFPGTVHACLRRRVPGYRSAPG
jgi:hypothetical protein